MRAFPLLGASDLFGFGCNSGYTLHGKTGTDPGTTTDTDTHVTGTPGDVDGDGIPDDKDDDCTVDVPGATIVAVDDTCNAPDAVVTDPWDVSIEWQWLGLAKDTSFHNVIITPVAGNLNDDNGDGVIDERDTPDVVFVAFSSSDFYNGVLVVLNGKTGTQEWTAPGFQGGGGIALADVDGDGITDILAFNSSNYPVAVNASGTTFWTASAPVANGYPQATVADVNEDGLAEVIADNLILNGKTGKVLQTLAVDPSAVYRLPAVGDIDGDGIQEVVLGSQVFDPVSGAQEWKSDFVGTYGQWSAIFDANGDGLPDVAMIGGGQYGVYNGDGSKIAQTSANASQPGAPCVADFDGDGHADIAWPSSAALVMYHAKDAKQIWSVPIDDSSGLASCSGYDVDGDGAYEILYADEHTFSILDGRTGSTRYSWNKHASGTLWEYPSVADVTQDGHADVIVAGNDYWIAGTAGVTVFGSTTGTWLKSGTTWHTHDFAVTNINDDGTVPAVPDPWWSIYNVYRSRPSVDGAATDLRAAIVDVCFAACEPTSPVKVAVQVYDYGASNSEKRVPVTLYRNDGGKLTAVATQILPHPIKSGTGSVGIEFDVTYADVGSDGFTVAVDDDGSGGTIQAECDESNNQGNWTDIPCAAL